MIHRRNFHCLHGKSVFMTGACDEFDFVQILSRTISLFMQTAMIYSVARLNIAWCYHPTAHTHNFHKHVSTIARQQIYFEILLCLLYLHVVQRERERDWDREWKKKRKKKREKSHVTVMALPSFRRVAMTCFWRPKLRTQLYGRFFNCRRYTSRVKCCSRFGKWTLVLYSIHNLVLNSLG